MRHLRWPRSFAASSLRAPRTRSRNRRRHARLASPRRDSAAVADWPRGTGARAAATVELPPSTSATTPSNASSSGALLARSSLAKHRRLGHRVVENAAPTDRAAPRLRHRVTRATAVIQFEEDGPRSYICCRCTRRLQRRETRRRDCAGTVLTVAIRCWNTALTHRAAVECRAHRDAADRQPSPRSPRLLRVPRPPKRRRPALPLARSPRRRRVPRPPRRRRPVLTLACPPRRRRVPRPPRRRRLAFPLACTPRRRRVPRPPRRSRPTLRPICSLRRRSALHPPPRRHRPAPPPYALTRRLPRQRAPTRVRSQDGMHTSAAVAAVARILSMAAAVAAAAVAQVLAVSAAFTR